MFNLPKSATLGFCALAAGVTFAAPAMSDTELADLPKTSAPLSIAGPENPDTANRVPSRNFAWDADDIGIIPQGAILTFDENGLIDRVLTDQRTAAVQEQDRALHALRP